MAEALQQECDVMRALLRRWLDETQWSLLDSGYWDEPDLYVCDWCKETATSVEAIKHASFCLVGQTLRVLRENRLEAIND